MVIVLDMRHLAVLGLAAMLALVGFAEAGPWRAGLSRMRITPDRPVLLSGYASRTSPATHTIQELYVRVLVLDDGSGRLAALVSCEILGFPAELSARIAAEVRDRYGLERDRLLLNSTHTHCGPAVAHRYQMIYGPRVRGEEDKDIEQYTRQLEAKVVQAIGAAIKDLGAARLRFGQGQAGFAMNRRLKTAGGFVIGVNPQGPVDPDVPCLMVESESGVLRGVVFGYACHNTTIGGDVNGFCGDYAGFCSEEIERRHPGVTAVFVQGCGGDINPHPRGTVELAQRHGLALADAVEQTMRGPLWQLAGPLKAEYQLVGLQFAPGMTRAALESQLQDRDIFRQWQARHLLKTWDREGQLPAEYPCPLQVWQFGGDLTLVAMGGEVVVDYALRLKKELGGQKLWVAGYCNDVFAYVPSRRVLEEGGYEADGAMVYYVQPGRFDASVEETIVRRVHELVDRVRK